MNLTVANSFALAPSGETFENLWRLRQCNLIIDRYTIDKLT